MLTLYVLVGFCLVIFVIGYFWIYRNEKRLWNNGVCPYNGKAWVYFDTDSQGGRGYKSDGYICWISTPFVDKNYDKEILK